MNGEYKFTTEAKAFAAAKSLMANRTTNTWEVRVTRDYFCGRTTFIVTTYDREGVSA